MKTSELRGCPQTPENPAILWAIPWAILVGRSSVLEELEGCCWWWSQSSCSSCFFSYLVKNLTMAKIPPRRKVVEKPPTAHHLWKVKPEMEKDFIDFCNESAALHGHKGHSLKEWTSVITKLNAKYDQHFDQKMLKNKWDALRQGYMVWRKLITKTGHGRNADGSFNWPPEVWKVAIEQDSRVAKFQFEPLKYHQELEMLFEGTFAAGESRENCGEEVVSDSFADVDVDADADPDVDADVFERETHWDLESDAYLSTARDDSPGLGASRDGSPMSAPCSGKASGSSLGKRKKPSGEGNKPSSDLAEITTMLQTHLASSQANVEMVRRRFEREEEQAKIEFERKEEEGRKANAYSLEQCCKIMSAMKELPEINLERRTYMVAKIRFSESYEYRMSFITEETIEDKVEFLKYITKG